METIDVNEFRRKFIEIGLRRAKAGTGSSLDVLERRSAVMKALDLGDILVGVRWAVVGGVATRTYMPERATLDIDILVAKRDAALVRTLMTKADFEFEQELVIGGSTWKSPDGRSLDILESNDPWVDEALRDVGTDPQGLPVLKLGFLVLMKLQSSRTQDLADVSRMLGGANEREFTDVLRVIAEYLPDAIEDLKSLIQLGKLERR